MAFLTYPFLSRTYLLFHLLNIDKYPLKDSTCPDGEAPVLFYLFFYLLWHNYLCSLFNDKSSFIKITTLFQKLQFSISTQFNRQKHFYFKLFSLIQQF